MSSSNTDFDTKLVDWLYGELDSDGLASFEAHLEAHPEHKAEAHALRETRIAFQGFPEAEPSTALTTMLMQQAAAEVQPKAGLWSAFAGFFQPVFLHPAASAMATVVLLAGVAGTLYLRNGQMVAEPTSAKSQSERPVAMAGDSESAPGAAMPEPALGSQDPAKREEAAEFDQVAAAPSDDSRDEGYTADLASPAQEQSVRAALDADGVLGGAVGNRGPLETTKKEADGFAFATDVTANAISGGARGMGGESLSLNESRTKNRDDGDAMAEPARRQRASVPPPAVKTAVAKKDEANWEQQQVVSFKAAARTKRCRDAGRIANDLQEKNPRAYDENVKGSPEESDCSYYIASETKRRSKAKTAKRALSKSKKSNVKGQGKSIPKKAVAAPQQDALEAADTKSAL